MHSLSISESLARTDIPKQELRDFLAHVVAHLRAEGDSNLRVGGSCEEVGHALHRAARSVEEIAHNDLQLLPSQPCMTPEVVCENCDLNGHCGMSKDCEWLKEAVCA